MRLTCVDTSIPQGRILAQQTEADAAHHFLWAVSIAQLLERLDGLDASFATVDVFAHGFGGGMTFGGETLFSSDGHGYERVARFGRVLAPGAWFRLLGCEVAGDSWWQGGTVRLSGRKLMLDLERRLGVGISVWAARTQLSFLDFHPRGLDDGVASRLLVSGGRTAHTEGAVGIAGGV